ncbi:MAG: hypothetical protein AB1410_07080 [Acidobacteriota bacterium]
MKNMLRKNAFLIFSIFIVVFSFIYLYSKIEVIKKKEFQKSRIEKVDILLKEFERNLALYKLTGGKNYYTALKEILNKLNYSIPECVENERDRTNLIFLNSFRKYWNLFSNEIKDKRGEIKVEYYIFNEIYKIGREFRKFSEHYFEKTQMGLNKLEILLVISFMIIIILFSIHHIRLKKEKKKNEIMIKNSFRKLSLSTEEKINKYHEKLDGLNEEFKLYTANREEISKKLFLISSLKKEADEVFNKIKERIVDVENLIEKSLKETEKKDLIELKDSFSELNSEINQIKSFLKDDLFLRESIKKDLNEIENLFKKIEEKEVSIGILFNEMYSIKKDTVELFKTLKKLF